MGALNRTQLVAVKAPVVHITQVRDGQGKLLPVEQSYRLTDVIETDFGDKKALEALFGSGEYANGLFSGKSELSFSVTVGSIGAALLNSMALGREVQAKQRKTHTDKSGVVIPETVFSNWTIRNLIGLNVARVDSVTGVTINGVPMVLNPATIAGNYEFDAPNSQLVFAEADVGKTAVATYVSNGRTLTVTFKILASRRFWFGGFGSTAPVVKNDTNTLIKDAFSTSLTPAVGRYMGTGGGIFYFNPATTIAATKKLTIVANNGGQLVTYALSTIPAAGYNFHIDAPGASTYVSTTRVELISNSGTAMTGVTVGGALTLGSGTPTSGEYVKDSAGEHTFAAADVGDVVRIYYVPSYFVLRPAVPDGGVFVESRGVYNKFGVHFTSVSPGFPLSVGNGQFAVDTSGAYYFDFSNAGDTVYMDFRYEIEGGSLIEVGNQDMGYSPAVRIDIDYEYEGESLSIELFYAKAKGAGIPMKQGASSPMKFEFMASEDRCAGTGRVWEASLSST